jgi:hypothetical protein
MELARWQTLAAQMTEAGVIQRRFPKRKRR